ncbi:hypothetical protein TNCV_2576381 [Trichonephila clavipes]|uniref:Uncharacterized protein n=1 Tax=Trichonephila clavipes TaxID=2585209 RepID=A0A8X6R5T1_TRICX|nr:hypothetical protein TNCV_2576381 [Trichonephila clavipes]
MPDIKINDDCLFEEVKRLNVYLNSYKLEQWGNQHAEIDKRWSNRGPRNSSRQEARSTPVVGLGIEHHTGDSTNYLDEIPRRDDRWLHLLSPPA